MRQTEAFRIQLNQLGETLKEFLDTKNSRDRLTRVKEMRAYLRSLTLIAEMIENEEVRLAPHLAAYRVLTRYRQHDS